MTDADRIHFHSLTKHTLSLYSRLVSSVMTKRTHFMAATRRSRRVDHLKIKADGDVWVEKKGLVDGIERNYFKSVKTKRCFVGEPPTGASHVIYLCEIHKYPADLQAFALGSSHEQVRRRGKVPKQKKRRRRHS